MSQIKIQDLQKSYNGKIVLDHLNLNMVPGRIYGLLAQNGEGKTTLFKLMAGVAVPDGGTIEIDGQPVGVKTKSHTAFLPEKSFLEPGMSCKANIDFMADFFEDFDPAKARELLKKLNIDENQKLGTMSKGMQEKANLALTLARSADLYLLDEPLAGVDPASREKILKTILANYSEKATVVISTHLISDVEQILDDVLFMKNGKIILQESADELRERKGSSVDQIFRREFSK